MKSNRIMWGLVSLVVLITIAVTVGSRGSHSQQGPQPTPTELPNKEYNDLSKYAVADYDAPEGRTPGERENRRLVGKRYDGEYLVQANPHSGDGGSVVHDELPRSPLLPIAGSDVIIVGKIVDASAYLSNDKGNVYTEFKVYAGEVIKNSASGKIERGAVITTDRQGGMVRYADGRKLIYKNARRKMLWRGGNYILFLAKDRESPNFKIITVYELTDDDFYELNSGKKPDEFKQLSKSDFIERIQTEVSRQPN
jgi:hypothetical protein